MLTLLGQLSSRPSSCPRTDETGSDQEARNDDAYAVFRRLSSSQKEKKKEVISSTFYVELSTTLEHRMPDQIRSSYNLQGSKVTKKGRKTL